MNRKIDLIRKEMLRMVTERGATKTICPSEVARNLFTNWEKTMEEVRRVACELHEAGQIEITQRGSVVKDLNFKGPIRLRMKGPKP
jgi:hypothetical protein